MQHSKSREQIKNNCVLSIETCHLTVLVDFRCRGWHGGRGGGRRAGHLYVCGGGLPWQTTAERNTAGYGGGTDDLRGKRMQPDFLLWKEIYKCLALVQMSWWTPLTSLLLGWMCILLPSVTLQAIEVAQMILRSHISFCWRKFTNAESLYRVEVASYCRV